MADAATACGHFDEDQTTNKSEARNALKQISYGTSVVPSSSNAGENKYKRKREDIEADLCELIIKEEESK